jgi:type II secretory pathway pseudopilin PulG
VIDAARAERGETLVELLATIVILGSAIIAVVAGIGVAIEASDSNSKQVTALTVIDNYSEAIAAAKYVPCASTADYLPGANVSYTPPTSFTVSIVGGISYYDGTSSAPASFSSTCPNPDGGAQRMTIRAVSSDGRADRSIEIVKRGP